jgi:imidazolonepropionase
MIVIRNARVATMSGSQAASGDEPLGLIESGTVVVGDDGLIHSVGPSAADADDAQHIDARGALLTPGLIEPHTHLLFGGDRAGEHAARLAGKSYLEIARDGGGIAATVRATRAAPDEELILGARGRLDRLARGGVTTVEVKSGYGLSVEQELRILRLIGVAAQGAPCEVVPTLLGLHAVPPELDRAAWVRAVVSELVPEVARLGLARGCDAFCEQGAFTPDECRAALEAGARAGLTPHLHADQLTAGGGAELAAELRCASADHLERTSDAGVAALARAGTAAVLLPLAAWFLREPRPAQAKAFLSAGVPVALGGNVNPGSQRIESVSLLLAAGCLLAGLTPAQALWACTAGGAHALRLPDRGRLATGLRGDLVLWATRDPAHLPYHAGVEHAALVIRSGRVVLDLRDQPPLC